MSRSAATVLPWLGVADWLAAVSSWCRASVDRLMPTRHRTSLCREGWYLLLLLAVVLTWALLRENNLLLIVAGLMGGTLLVNWRLSRATLRRLEVRRCVVSESQAGNWLTVEIEVVNGRRRLGSWAVSVEDCLERRIGSGRRDAVAAGGDVSLRPRRPIPAAVLSGASAAARPLRAGAAAAFPRGFLSALVQSTLWLEAKDQLVVLPRLGRLRPGLAAAFSADAARHARRRRPGYVPGDFFAVREWQAGDSVRWVHWRSTARHRELVVRQFERPGERELAVLLDLWEPREPQADQRTPRGTGREFRRHAGHGFLPPRAAASCSWRLPRLQGRSAWRARRPPRCSRDAMEALAVAQASPAAPLSALRDEVLEPRSPPVRCALDQHSRARRGRTLGAAGGSHARRAVCAAPPGPRRPRPIRRWPTTFRSIGRPGRPCHEHRSPDRVANRGP